MIEDYASGPLAIAKSERKHRPLAPPRGGYKAGTGGAQRPRPLQMLPTPSGALRWDHLVAVWPEIAGNKATRQGDDRAQEATASSEPTL